MLPRTLEPEVMDTREEAVDYDQMDHSGVNRVFVDEMLAFLNSMPHSSKTDAEITSLQRVLDLGTGTAQIPIELMARDNVRGHVTAADLSREMLIVAQQNVAAAGLADQISLLFADCKRMPSSDDSFDGSMSNSIIHHIPEPFLCLSEMVRVTRPGGWLFIRDLMRPADAAAVDALVTTYAGDENQHQQQMFRESLHAALTVEEVRGLLKRLGLPAESVQATSDRHWTIATTLPE